MMKLVVLTLMLAAGTSHVKAQGDSTVYIQGLPVTEDDTAQQFPRQDIYPKNAVTPVRQDQIPSRLRKTLQGDDTFEGWEKSPVYLEQNTGLYIIHITQENDVKTFRFNEKGKPVTYNESTRKVDH